MPVSTAQSDSCPAGDQEDADLIPTGSDNIDHEIFSSVILSLPLIQEGQLSVSESNCAQVLVNRLKN